MSINAIKYQDGYKYRLEGEFSARLPEFIHKPYNGWYIDAGLSRIEFYDDHTFLTIHRGFCWDGASGAIDTETVMVPALIHDALYACLRHAHEIFVWQDDKDAYLEPLKIYADDVFLDKCKEFGMNKIRAGLFRAAVGLFGHQAASKERDYKYLKLPE